MGRAGQFAAGAAALIAGTLSAYAEPSEKLAPCLACHGATGQSEVENVPSLGAKLARPEMAKVYACFAVGLMVGSLLMKKR